MSGLSEYFNEVQAGGQATPNELDRYEHFLVFAPMMGTFIWGTAEGTSTTSPTVAFSQVYPDYPRNVTMTFLPASGSITGGTFTLKGKDQFGAIQSETFSIGTAVNGGTAIGTKVFAKFTSCVGTIGTSDAGVGTLNIVPADKGTTALFGLMSKIASTLDVKMMTFGSTGVAKAVNGGTFGAFVDVATSSIKAPNTITTPAANATWIKVVYKPSWSNAQKTNMAGL